MSNLPVLYTVNAQFGFFSTQDVKYIGFLLTRVDKVLFFLMEKFLRDLVSF